MAKLEPEVLAHLEWLGYAQPTGLVVSAPALARAGAILDRRDTAGQQSLRECAQERDFGPKDGRAPYLPDFRMFAQQVLEWSFRSSGYAGTAEAPIPSELELPLPECGDTLKPDFAVRELEPRDGASRWQLLVRVLEPGDNFDVVIKAKNRLEASPHGAFERLLRHTGVPAGLLFNGRTLRLLSAPRGESSGWVDFRVGEMLQTAGRPLCTALRLLLRERRLLALARGQRLAALLEDSRKFQNEVSERLAEQVLHALYELLRGFQAAHEASGQTLLQDVLTESPSDVYRGLLTVLLRMVFLLYAEERDMLPSDEVFLRAYSLAGLHARLREDAALYPDTLDQRFGAWAQLLAVFRMLHDGADLGVLRLPARHGVLFDPNRYPFLEGRPLGEARQTHLRVEAPLVSDGTIYRALEKLLVLDGERISYRALDVEQIGSVYETMMGFRLETAVGRSVAIKAAKKQGAPTTVDLDALLEVASGKRESLLGERIDRKLSETVKRAVAAAQSVEDLHAALLPLVDTAASPDRIPPGAMVLQPSEERRRSGSHYTPRSLTEPIVRTTLEPILARLRGMDGKSPKPADILDLKVCDPAMGSGAFLVEACRQLGDALVESWRMWGEKPNIPPDEDEVLFARRLVAQRCLYGIDRNPMAVDLAKVSLWLVTLAKEHALTFVDHALRHGDSLVGLSRRQIEAFHWEGNKPVFEMGLETLQLQEHLARAAELRGKIREAGEGVADAELRRLWEDARHEMDQVRLSGDLVVAAYFSGEKPKERESSLRAFANRFVSGDQINLRVGMAELRQAEHALVPFHWELEFPEVFDRNNPGFDVFVGNPPFMGGSKISTSLGAGYLEWILDLHEGAHGNGDLVAHFFRRSFNLLRMDGALGLIATNTIAQGDTRTTALRWICNHQGEVYRARKRFKWPGLAAVVVSIVHVSKGHFWGPKYLDERNVEAITAFLFHRGYNDDPIRLSNNAGRSFLGTKVYGQGFTFDDSDSRRIATSIAEMRRLITSNPANQNVIFPYIGGEEVNTSPSQKHDRFVINFGEREELQCRAKWPDLMAIVEAKVKPERIKNNREIRRRYWWRFGETTPALFKALQTLENVLVVSRIGQFVLFTSLPTNMVFSEQLVILVFDAKSALCVLQSRAHEFWVRFFGSSMKDDLRYTPSDCFETFPFPKEWESHPALEVAGKAYYDFRAALMIRNNEGLTQTYNRFHNPEERDPDIQKLRELHAAMDRAVLDSYGWNDVPTECQFLLDYEIDEEEWGDKKKPWRYRWPDSVRDEVLARLLELNTQRAKDEALRGAAAATSKSAQAGPKKGRGKRSGEHLEAQDLFSQSS
jgi:hypothetical protein